MINKKELLALYNKESEKSRVNKMRQIDAALRGAATNGSRQAFIDFQLRDEQIDAIQAADVTVTVIDRKRSDDPYYRLNF